MKIIIAAIFLLLANATISLAQDSAFHVYNTTENAAIGLHNAVTQAHDEGKHVLVQIGGNWCRWCIQFYKFSRTDAQVDSLIKADYIVYHLNYSKENKNYAVMEKLGFPQRFGFPVFIILDGNGERLHTQSSEYLEQGNSYNKRKTMEFLENWNVRALDPKQYKN